MQHLLYQLPVPQTEFLDLSGSSLMYFFTYDDREILKSLSADLLNSLSLIYLGSDLFQIQQWSSSDSISKPIKWAGPEGLNSSLCTSLEIKEIPVFIGLSQGKVVYYSTNIPSTRFLQDFISGEVLSIAHEISRQIIDDIVSNVAMISGGHEEVPKLDEKSYGDAISLLQHEILNYQALCKQQQLMIESLREELLEKRREIQSLNEIV